MLIKREDEGQAGWRFDSLARECDAKTSITPIIVNALMQSCYGLVSEPHEAERAGINRRPTAVTINYSMS